MNDAEGISDLTRRLRKGYDPKVAHEVDPTPASLVTLLQEAARKWPDRVATDFLGSTYTFASLEEQTRKAAGVLASLGVEKGDRVSLIMPNCPQFLTIFFGALHLGAIAVAHNPLAPSSELHTEIERVSSKVVLAWQKSVKKVLDTPAKVVAVDLAAALPLSARLALRLPISKARNLRRQLCQKVPAGVPSFDRLITQAKPILESVYVDPEQTAVMMHTGGTTGSPKSVMLSSTNLVSNTRAAAQWVTPLLHDHEVIYSVLPFFHAFGMTLVMLSGILVGASQVIFPKFDESLCLSAWRRRPCTFMIGVPPMFARLAKAAKAKRVDLKTINYTISGAMPLKKEDAAAWAKATDAPVIEGYGMTETSPIVTGSPLGSTRVGTLGLPFPSIQVRLVSLDDPTRDVDDLAGEPGELIVKGPGCSKGYWNDPVETENLYTSEGWLRTGDIAVNDDGYLALADRRKELILCGGFNVYPTLVEKAIASRPEVEDVAVVGLPDAERGEIVAAAVIPHPGCSPSLASIRKHIDAEIPHYAMPRKIFLVDHLPKSDLGKVLRREVREQLLSSN